jgi:uncharacterized protein YtpQ (UPF0354 family)
MRFLLVAFSALMLFVGGASADVLSKRAFTDAVAAAATASMPSAKVTVTGDLQVEIRPLNGGPHITADLSNAYGLYLEAPGRLNNVIRTYVSTWSSALNANAYVVDRSRIVPVIKSRKWFDDTEGALRIEGKHLQHAPDLIGGELMVVYAMDSTKTMRYLMTRDEVGDPAKLGDLAVENLKRLLPKIEMRGASEGLWLISVGGDYESSLLLFDELWASGQIKVDGKTVVAVPAKDALFVTGSHNHTGISRMREVAAELAAGPYGLTPDLFVYNDGKFVKFDGN